MAARVTILGVVSAAKSRSGECLKSLLGVPPSDMSYNVINYGKDKSAARRGPSTERAKPGSGRLCNRDGSLGNTVMGETSNGPV